ncbi:MAG: hypothetical protein LBJ60_06045 [Tannerellaceae bacterium]|jgi:hypothetical protein|nr:hypothetical protein [Tannerellaceae bacterium]
MKQLEKLVFNDSAKVLTAEQMKSLRGGERYTAIARVNQALILRQPVVNVLRSVIAKVC